MSNAVAKKGGNPKRKMLYAEAAKHAPRAIEVLVDLMNNGDNDNVRMGAAKVILQKSIPDLKAIEVSGDEGRPLGVIILPKENVSKLETTSRPATQRSDKN